MNFPKTTTLLLTAAFVLTAHAVGGGWPNWRGPGNDGMAEGGAPVEWSGTKNVKWTIDIPGRGFSSPVIWGDKLFITTAIPQEDAPAAAQQGGGRGAGGGAGPLVRHHFDLICLDKNTGKVLWQRTATEAAPHEGYHRMYGSFASHSPVTDGKHVIAFFGSRGVYAYDLDGNKVWGKDLGVKMQTRLSFGEGVAPVLHGGKLILTFDHEGDSFIVTLDKNTGEELWRKDRDEPSAWSPPFVTEFGGRTEVIVSATNKVRSYDIETGELIWECGGLGSNVIPAPVRHEDIVFVMSGHREPNLLAIRLGGKGDITGSDRILWTNQRANAYTASPVLHDGKLYFITDNGFVSCFDAKTGEPYYHQVRLPNPYKFKASPVGADGKLYLATEEGDVVVLKMGEDYEVVAVNKMGDDEIFISSPAIVDGEIFLRSQDKLFAISDKARAGS